MEGMEERINVDLPEAFVHRMKNLLGEEYPCFLASYQSPRAQGLRLNGLKGEKEDLKAVCSSFMHLEPVAWAEYGFYYGNEERPGKHPYHEAGLYYIQEPSAMAVVEALDVRPGEKVLDLCAAPGGKSTQIASCLQGQGLLISNEIHPVRAKILSQNIERMGAANVAVTNHDARTLANWLPEFFDKIVVDAPCSGEGMFRKEPEARQEWTPDSPRRCSLRQQEILESAAQMLRPGGRLVYSTCTFAPEENEGTVEAFLQGHPEFFIEEPAKEIQGFSGFEKGRPDWILEENGKNKQPGEGDKRLEFTFRLWPHQIKGEGHFLAVLKKKGTDEDGAGAEDESRTEAESRREIESRTEAESRREIESRAEVESRGEIESRTDIESGVKAGRINKKKGGKKGEKNIERNRERGKALGIGNHELEQFFAQFSKEVFCSENEERAERLWERAEEKSGSRFMFFGEQLYSVPEQLPDICAKKVLRPGLHLGSFKKNRFEPSHALALYLKKEQVKQWVSLDSRGEWVIRYLKGETLSVEELLSQGEGKCSSSVIAGWVLVTVDGYSLGWAKAAGGRLQNHYPKGLRWGQGK